MEYDILEVLREKSGRRGQSIDWLCSQVGKSRNWFYGIKSFKQLTYEQIELLSKALEFDLMADFNQFQQQNGEVKILGLLHDPEVEMKINKPISATLKITGQVDMFQENFGKLLGILKRAGDQLGFKIE